MVVCDTDAGHAKGNGFFDLGGGRGMAVPGKIRVEMKIAEHKRTLLINKYFFRVLSIV
jgi:hypothetical protein